MASMADLPDDNSLCADGFWRFFLCDCHFGRQIPIWGLGFGYYQEFGFERVLDFPTQKGPNFQVFAPIFILFFNGFFCLI